MKIKQAFTFAITLMLTAVSCMQNKEAEPIYYGKDQCDYCKMTISNPKFGAELITDKGRISKYDATECLINHLIEEDIGYYKLYAVPFNEPKQLKAVEALSFLITPEIRSPMGANLSAYSDSNQLDPKFHKHLINWEALLKTFK